MELVTVLASGGAAFREGIALRGGDDGLKEVHNDPMRGVYFTVRDKSVLGVTWPCPDKQP